MKRLFTLIALLGLLGVFAGCDNGTKTPPPSPDTNAAPATPPSTNK